MSIDDRTAWSVDVLETQRGLVRHGHGGGGEVIPLAGLHKRTMTIDLTTIIGLGPHTREVMRQLFFYGPTWDGNIVSKSGRDELFKLKLIDRREGWSFLTSYGVQFSIRVLLLHEQKERIRRSPRETKT